MDKHSEALRLKTLAEESYTSSNLAAAVKYAARSHRLCPSIDNLSEMLTAFQILSASATDWYKILQIEPFSHINLIKKQYRKLALTLHPDKNPFAACEEAFKLVAEGFRVLSDKTRRKEYDTKLRMKMQEAAMGDDVAPVDLFWTSCLACRTRHQFDRKYLGHDLMCPSCKKSFKAFEAKDSEDCGEKEDGAGQRSSAKIRTKEGGVSSRTENGKLGNKGGILRSKRGFNEVLEVNDKEDLSVEEGVIGSRASSRLKARVGKVSLMTKNYKLGNKYGSLRSKRGSEIVLENCKSKRERIGEVLVNDREDISDSEGVLGSWTSARIRGRDGGMRSKTENGESGNKGRVVLGTKSGACNGVSDDVSEKSKSERAISEDEEITLAEMQKLEKRGVVMEFSSDKELKISKLKKAKGGGERITLAEMQILEKKAREEKMRLRVKEKPKEIEKVKESGRSSRKFEDKKQKEASDDEDLEIMAVEDSDFYDFDKDRVERSFKKGQVWAFYDDDDGMPRHYGLINEVSVYPFKVKLSWLELQNNTDDRLLNWENSRVRVSCGKFKVTKTELIDSVNVFSHYVDAERAARELYRVYPKKGSVWALFNETESQNKDKRCYGIVVCLTSYDEVYGLSMAYLEKVEGFRSVFKRREIGCHAVKSVEKSDFQLFSHQIPARKLFGEEAVDIYGDCWELDPASLPSELLRIGWNK